MSGTKTSNLHSPMSLPSTIRDFTNLSLPPHIRAVLLDFDNTCYAYDPCHAAALVSLQKAIQDLVGDLPDFEMQYRAAQKIVKARIPTHGASHSRALYIQTLLEQVGAPDTITPVPALENQYWDTFATVMQPVPGLLDFLAECKKSETTVVVVTDLTTTIQCHKLALLGLAPWISYLVTSEEAGAEKPDATPFKLGLLKAGCSAQEAVMIGDSIEKDIEGAAALGIATIHCIHENVSQ